MDSVTVTVDGLDEALAEMRQLQPAVQTKIMKGAAATGCSVFRKDAVRRAPEFHGVVSNGHPPPGTLKSAIYQTRLPQQCTPTTEVWKVDVRRGKFARAVGKKQRNLDAFYAYWVEVGHYARLPKASRKKTAIAQALGAAEWVPASPFMRPAFETQQRAAFDAMSDYILKNLSLATAVMHYLKAA